MCSGGTNVTQANDPKTQPPPQEDGMTLMTVEEVVDLLKLSERTVRLWMANGKLPFIRLGEGKAPPVRIRKKDVLSLMRPGAPAA